MLLLPLKATILRIDGLIVHLMAWNFRLEGAQVHVHPHIKKWKPSVRVFLLLYILPLFGPCFLSTWPLGTHMDRCAKTFIFRACA